MNLSFNVWQQIWRLQRYYDDCGFIMRTTGERAANFHWRIRWPKIVPCWVLHLQGSSLSPAWISFCCHPLLSSSPFERFGLTLTRWKCVEKFVYKTLFELSVPFVSDCSISLFNSLHSLHSLSLSLSLSLFLSHLPSLSLSPSGCYV